MKFELLYVCGGVKMRVSKEGRSENEEESGKWRGERSDDSCVGC